MCDFFSFVTDPGRNKTMFFDWEMRELLGKGIMPMNGIMPMIGDTSHASFETDSHTSIAHFFGYQGAKEDVLNKYEYNPFTGLFRIDQINNRIDDSKAAKKWVTELDFKIVCPYIKIKPFVNAFKLPKVTNVTSAQLDLLRQWASVVVKFDFRGEAQKIAGLAEIFDFAVETTWRAIGHLWAAALRPAVNIYAASFFMLPQWDNLFPHQPVIDLWNQGLIPGISFTTGKWCLHSGKNDDIVWQGDVV